MGCSQSGKYNSLLFVTLMLRFTLEQIGLMNTELNDTVLI